MMLRITLVLLAASRLCCSKGEFFRQYASSSSSLQRKRIHSSSSSRASHDAGVAQREVQPAPRYNVTSEEEKWRKSGIVVNAMHPGWADTPGVETALPAFYRVTRKFLRTPEEGADTMVWLAASTEAGKVSGKLWLDREQHPSHISRRTRETAAEREELLQILEELCATTSFKPTKRKRQRRSA